MSTTLRPTYQHSKASAHLAHDLADVIHVEARPKSLRKKRTRLAVKLAAVIAVAGLLAWAGYRWLGPRSEATLEITATVTRATLPIAVTERGELDSSKTVDARCEVEGYKSKIVEIVPEGSRVTKGQVVIRFDTEELDRSFREQQIKWEQAEGRFEATTQELEVQKNKSASEVATAELALRLAELDRVKYLKGDYLVEHDDKKGQIALTERDLHEAREKLAHYRDFVKKGFGTPEQLRLKEIEVDKAQYYLKRDKIKLEVLETYTRERQEVELTAKASEAKRQLERTQKTSAASIKKAQSDLKAAEVTAGLEKSRLARFQRQLDACIVKAPQDGILVYAKDRYYDESSRIRLGGMAHFQQVLFRLPDLAQMQMKLKIHESVVKKVQPGHQAEIRIDALPNAVLHGTVESVATLADADRYWDERGVKEYVTVVKINDLPADGGLKPGMTGEVKVLVNELPDVLVIPVQAVTEKEGQHYSYVVGADGVERRAVDVGDNNEKFIEIKSGLSDGEQVALNARARIAAETKREEQKAPAPTKAKASPPPKSAKSAPVAKSK